MFAQTFFIALAEISALRRLTVLNVDASRMFLPLSTFELLPHPLPPLNYASFNFSGNTDVGPPGRFMNYLLPLRLTLRSLCLNFSECGIGDKSGVLFVALNQFINLECLALDLSGNREFKFLPLQIHLLSLCLLVGSTDGFGLGDFCLQLPLGGLQHLFIDAGAIAAKQEIVPVLQWYKAARRQVKYARMLVKPLEVENPSPELMWLVEDCGFQLASNAAGTPQGTTPGAHSGSL
eukprot:TRINITY_DN35860_c0_g2_i1.p1 TRINITY_DN35860_c0_g2~~TRINITY_DN35860_c0_g2_i1.p1  ORF type:complete len:235 (+),score=1.92 TRINITY_DN35860_c0_g2_i1:455-1159(+)